MGFLIEPPRPIEGDFVAIFAQTDIADELALTLLRERGFDVRPFPVMGDLAFEGIGGMLGSTSLFGGESLVCVPRSQVEAATAVLVEESGLVEDQNFVDE
jgi:hypothetical protein